MIPSEPLSPPASTSASELLRELQQLNEQLAVADLHPSPAVNAAFNRLVGLCATADEQTSRNVLAHADSAELVSSLREISARGETRLEQHWAREVASAEDAWSALKRFPYLENYRDLVRVELAAAGAVGRPAPRSVVVLGSGPLPLTGLLLAHDHGARVVNVDRDAGACALGAEVTSALALSDRARTLHAEASDVATLEEVAEADLVLLAALVGADGAAKRPVLDSLARTLRPEATLLVRSAERLRTALYPRISPDELHGFRPLLEVHPWDEVVNSVLVARPDRS